MRLALALFASAVAALPAAAAGAPATSAPATSAVVAATRPTPRPARRTPAVDASTPAPGTDRVVVRRLDLGEGTDAVGWADEQSTSATVTGGTPSTDGRSLDLTRGAAPGSVYRDDRFGTMHVTWHGLRPTSRYVLRLHLLEPFWSAPGQRVFDVTANGSLALQGVDVVALAGGRDRALTRDVVVWTTSAGDLDLGFLSRVDQAAVAGLELFWDQPAKERDLFPADRTTRVMALGDSITVGSLAEWEGGYRVPLWDAMAQAGWSFAPVGPVSGPPSTGAWAGAGYAGWGWWRIDELLGATDLNTTGRSIDDWLWQYSPDVVLLHIGNNDNETYEPQTRMRAELTALLERIHAVRPGADVLVARIANQRVGTNQDITRYNEAVSDVAQAQSAAGRPVHLVEMESRLTPDLFADAYHPSAAGYDVMARTWMGALRSLSR